MKEKVLLLIAIIFMASCSKDLEVKNPDVPVRNFLLESYETNKDFGVLHNTMLDNHYHYLKGEDFKIKKSVVNEEGELDNYIHSFIASNRELLVENGEFRSFGGDDEIFSKIKEMAYENKALFGNLRSSTNSDKNLEYLEYFCDEFYKTEISILTDVDLRIKETFKKVSLKYPNLSNEDLSKLSFVAGVTYNSCMYWKDNSHKWTNLSGENNEEFRSIWGSIGKWAYADTKGAIGAFAVSWYLTGAAGGMNLLAGAAVGSTIGAVENTVDVIKSNSSSMTVEPNLPSDFYGVRQTTP